MNVKKLPILMDYFKVLLVNSVYPKMVASSYWRLNLVVISGNLFEITPASSRFLLVMLPLVQSINTN